MTPSRLDDADVGSVSFGDSTGYDDVITSMFRRVIYDDKEDRILALEYKNVTKREGQEGDLSGESLHMLTKTYQKELEVETIADLQEDDLLSVAVCIGKQDPICEVYRMTSLGADAAITFNSGKVDLTDTNPWETLEIGERYASYVADTDEVTTEKSCDVDPEALEVAFDFICDIEFDAEEDEDSTIFSVAQR